MVRIKQSHQKGTSHYKSGNKKNRSSDRKGNTVGPIGCGGKRSINSDGNLTPPILLSHPETHIESTTLMDITPLTRSSLGEFAHRTASFAPLSLQPGLRQPLTSFDEVSTLLPWWVAFLQRRRPRLVKLRCLPFSSWESKYNSLKMELESRVLQLEDQIITKEEHHLVDLEEKEITEALDRVDFNYLCLYINENLGFNEMNHSGANWKELKKKWKDSEGFFFPPNLESSTPTLIEDVITVGEENAGEMIDSPAGDNV
ncbi:hypothetical protein GOBAR_AA03556 [Gossypium barbadense]|uniref:Uncharacterized protein n=1 Tax=Gossypium barbadense TaxID=3634 RepID=A0A2P5YN50_GOSBA|nr:hypothetical protein GOBAR_AA03556 [Gossypium barbadense]